jgi:hypothetical protein
VLGLGLLLPVTLTCPTMLLFLSRCRPHLTLWLAGLVLVLLLVLKKKKKERPQAHGGVSFLTFVPFFCSVLRD